MATTFTTSQPIRPWPAGVCPSEMTLQLQAHTSRFSSPFTRTTQTQELPGGLFRLILSFPPIQGEQIDMARAWFARLRGAAGRFYWPANGTDFRIPSAYASEQLTFTRLDVSTTRITVDRTDITIDADLVALEPVFTPDGLSTDRTRITGTLWLNSNQKPLRAGGYVSFDDADGWRHLHVVVEVILSAVGPDVIVIEPPMRYMPTSSTAIHVINPSGVFALNDDDQGALSLEPGGFGRVATVEATQALPIRVIA